MKNTFGNNLTMTLFGESHGEQIGCVLDGLAAGLPVDEDFIRTQLALRRPEGDTATARVEQDEFRIVSGVYQSRTTGTPLCLLIPNTQARSKDYVNLSGIARPSHADYTQFEKSHGFADLRGGGHASGRLTAPLVAAGAILIAALREKGILIGTHIAQIAGKSDRAFSDLSGDIALLNERRFAVLDEDAEEKMKAAILTAKADDDSVGGVLETAVTGVPAGLGEPWFDSLEGLLSHAMFSVPAVKGVEFGDGFSLADMRGSEANDAFRIDGGRVVTATNHSGGIGGGISNGMPLLFRCAIKPTPSIARPQDTVDYVNLQETTVCISGRHDPCIVPRARVVVDSLTALVLADCLAGRYGTDWLTSES